ncbi:serine/threonine-protein kinase [Lentisphaera araneosa HTCC2155]|uniref:Serine/threonine-protein kinase n=1 Tax=Lentisphaera araneosa HTCC2155 TaxID=313628 RepID=A6DGN1_9BACT|nr:serine/threonine-protein kinase [Lentisphaera araneosa]EDM29348.1 serine/threonine-protein kinase [Lentisphaera araneosa HTCC2155]
MSDEDDFADGLGELFDEAYNCTDTKLTESLKQEEDIYSDFSLYSEGGLKRIELCYNRKTNRKVAMATLKEADDPQKVEVFLREAKLNAALQHPNIVPVYNIGLDEAKPWFTMKFIAGISLKDTVCELREGKASEFQDLNARLDLFLKVCDAIAYAHSLGVIHLDIKPDNIRISKYGDVVVCDWGLADVEASSCDELLLEYCSVLDHDIKNHTMSGTVKGSPGYMAPEQTAKVKMRKGFHTDIFSLGSLLYALLTYRAPFDSESIDTILENTAKCDFPKPSKLDLAIPVSLEAICLKAMSLRPEDRYPSVEGLQKDILAYRNGFAPEAEQASSLKTLKLLIKRHKALSLLSLFTFALLALATFILFNNLKLSEKNAAQLADKLQLEQEFNKQMGVDAAPLFLERAIDTFDICNFDESLRFANNAVSRDASMQDAWLVKAKNHFIREEYQATIDAFAKVNSEDHDLVIEIARKYLKIKPLDSSPLTVPQLLNLLAELKPLARGDIYWKVVHYKAFQDLNIEERIAFCRGVIRVNHGASKAKMLNFKFDVDTKHLDVSNNPWLNVSLCFMNFPAKSINLSRTGMNNSIGLRSIPLEEVDMSYTKIIELQTFPCKKVTKLNISGNTIFHITPIVDLPIESLQIQNTLIRNTHDLVQLKRLKELHIHQGQFSKNELDRLDQKIKIVVHQKRE